MRCCLGWFVLCGALAAAGGCGPGGGDPCGLDCGPHGQCAIRSGRAECLCAAGWAGERCDRCADGYRAQGTDCVPVGPDPCTPNPCTKPYQTVCQVVEYEAVCRCDPGAQDADGDGLCLPDCAALTVDFPAQPCDDSSGEALLLGPRSCTTLVRTELDQAPAGALYLRGEHDGWEPGTELEQVADGVWQVALDLPAGDYAYKLYDAGAERWFEDPANPFHLWRDGERNSRLRVPDCEEPLLVLLHQPVVEQGEVRFSVQYLDGAQGAGLADAGISVHRGDVPLEVTFDPASGVARIADAGRSNGKWLYRIEAADNAGRSARALVVPVWVEPQPFDWRDAVLYFAMTDRFANGDPGNDDPAPDVDPKANWHGGDLAGLRQWLEAGYFDELGVNALWLSSVSHNTGGGFWGSDGRRYAAYHSYWPISSGWTDAAPLPGVLPVDPHFGDLEQLRELVRIAHAHGIRVVVDLVLNHVHRDSPLWDRHELADPPWFHLPPAGCQETDWTQPITCWFADYLPDLRYRNPAVMDALMDHAVWLVRTTGIDGFRVDAVKHMIDDVVLHLRGRIERELRRSGLRFYLVGETFTGEDGADQLAHYVGPDRLDGQFDFPLFWQVTAVLLRQERDLGALRDMVGWNDGRYGDWAVMSTFLGNHDVCRALSQAAGDIGDLWCNGGKEQGWTAPPPLPATAAPFERLRLAWTFLLTSPGVPLIYYGDELGLAGAGDPDNRRPMPAAAAWTDQQRATLEHVRRLTALRHAHPALRRGQRHSLWLAPDRLLWAYGLEWGGDRVLVVLNRDADRRPVEVPVAALGLEDGSVLADGLDGGRFEVSSGRVAVEVAGQGAVVLVAQ